LYALRSDALNYEAWVLYVTAVTRLTMDGHLLGLVLERLLADCDRDKFTEVLARLNVAYDTFNPPPPEHA
jgi:hypothetical protein